MNEKKKPAKKTPKASIRKASAIAAAETQATPKQPVNNSESVRLREYISRTPALHKYHIMVADPIDPELQKRLDAAEALWDAEWRKENPTTQHDTELTERDHEIFRDINEQLKPYFESKPPKE